MDSCIDCVAKHVAKAEVLLNEYLSDRSMYFEHYLRSAGELAAAEDESRVKWPALADMIRSFRLSLFESFPAAGCDFSEIYAALQPIFEEEHGGEEDTERE